MCFDAPEAPDPAQTANAQFDYNTGASLASGIINNPNVVGPGGSTSYNQSSTETITLPNGQKVQIPRYTQTTTLSPTQQKQYDQRQAVIGNLLGQTGTLLGKDPTTGAPAYQSSYQSGKLKTGFSGGGPTVGFGNIPVSQQMYGKTNAGTRAYSDTMDLDEFGGKLNLNKYGTNMNLGEFGGQLSLGQYAPSYTGKDVTTSYTPEGGFSADRQRVEEAMMGRADALTKSTRDSEIARLSAMGLAPGSEKYGRVSDQFEKAQNDRAMAAILAGGEEQSRMLGEARAAAGFGNQAVGQAYDMDMGLRSAENDRLMKQMGFNRDTLAQNNLVRQAEAEFGLSKEQLENKRLAEQLGFNRDTMNQNNLARQAESQFGFGVSQAENTRRMGEATFGRDTVEQNNRARQAQATMQMARTEMENARRRGDTAAYNQALESYNNAQIQQTTMNAGQAQFSNQTRQAMVQEMLGLQGNKLNQLLSLMTGQQQSNPNAPTFQGQSVAAPNYSGLVTDNYGQQVGSYNNLMTGLSSILGIGAKAATGMM